VWLVFVVFPLIDAFTNTGPAIGHLLVIAGAVVFVASYVWLVLIWTHARTQVRPFLLLGVLTALAIVLTVADRPSWGFLFTYCAACAALVAPTWLGLPAVFFYVGLGTGCAALGGASSGGALGYGASTLGVGLLLVLMRDLRVRNAELDEARAELAQLAVARERERFARDLHDLLGHTLSVIALKAELAGRLLRDRPEQAAIEVAEVEQVARNALSEVREAVSGYRRPTLDGELEGARMALSAAGIEADVQRSIVKLEPAVEAVLAWAVREGATNVIRHSRAHRCTLTISAGLIEAEVEVMDDGVGAGGTDGNGNGLAGLGERAESLRGRVEAGPRSEGGFRLAVSVPVAA
jgi:two-component system sensor histidine kinase DesK